MSQRCAKMYYSHGDAGISQAIKVYMETNFIIQPITCPIYLQLIIASDVFTMI